MLKKLEKGDKILAIMPVFHGFGLAVCIHTPLTFGMKCTLIPQFKVKEFGDLIRRYKPNFIVGVPTLFEALLKQKLKANELECVEAVISGGDFLTENQKKAIDKFLQEHGSKAHFPRPQAHTADFRAPIQPSPTMTGSFGTKNLIGNRCGAEGCLPLQLIYSFYSANSFQIVSQPRTRWRAGLFFNIGRCFRRRIRGRWSRGGHTACPGAAGSGPRP